MNKNGMRNPIIEFWRFVACVAIAAFHFEWVYIGHPVYLVHFYIWVEFFFILSGFFVASNTIDSNKEFTTLGFLKREFKKVYPMYLVAFVFSFCITNLVNDIKVKEWILLLWQSKWELLPLQMTGFVTSGVSYNVASGYVSALLISTFIIHFLLKNNFKIFINIIAPSFIICGYARLIVSVKS